MRKHRKHKKNQSTCTGSYKRFLIDMQIALSVLKEQIHMESLSNWYKRKMYTYRFTVLAPKSGNGYMTTKELKLIAEKIRYYYKELKYEYNGMHLSCYQIQLLYCFMKVRSIVLRGESNKGNQYYVKAFAEVATGLLETSYSQFVYEYYKVITQLCNPENKYYTINVEFAKIRKDNPRLELVAKVYGIPIGKKCIKINNQNRLVYRLGKPVANKKFEWISLHSSWLRDYWKGCHKLLPVYIQSHALKRLKERLDLLDSASINYALWENTLELKGFHTYKDCLLFPFKLYDIKVGYLVATVIGELLVFRTFLFITHNSTPEGDRLKELTGLGKRDISYWQIDRLSTFMQLEESRNPHLHKFFAEAGLGELNQLKEKDFNTEYMQAGNLDGLANYLLKGQQAEKVQEEEWEKFLLEA